MAVLGKEDSGIELMKAGDRVIFDINNRLKTNFITISKNAKIKIGRGECPSTDLIGHPFGTLFQLSEDGQSLVPVPHEPSCEWGHTLTCTGDNRSIHDDALRNQQLSHFDIELLKEQGTSGSEIVGALLDNSSTYEVKSAFSQEKYKKKKAKKYILVGCARRPTACSLAEAYFSKQPSRIGFLRYDTLALTLTLANIGARRKVLVIEGSSGLVTGAVAERLGGHGEICAAHFGKKSPGIAISDMFNLPESSKKIIYTKSLLDLLQEVHGLEPKPLETGQQTQGRFDSCIITNQSYCIKSALFASLPLLSPSASFAVACPHMQPLIETMHLLKMKGFAVAMSFIEPWYRELQILPHRTHPLMNMNHGGWYILCGTTTKAATMVDLSLYQTVSD